MTYKPQAGFTAEIILATAVVDTGTFTVAYPTGSSQASFNAGLEDYGQSYIMLNDSDKVAQDPTNGVTFAYGASEITITNETGATFAAGTKVRCWFATRRGDNVEHITIPVSLDTVTAADVVTSFRPGVYGYIEHMSWITDVAPSASDAATFNLEIGTTNVTGGVIVLDSAAAGVKGTVVESTPITANNRITPESLVSIEAANVTDYASGSGSLVIRIRKDML